MDQRRDALAGAAKLALEIREIAKRAGGGAVCTTGGVVCKPGIVTSVVETAEQLLDQRHLDAAKLASMWEQVREACERFAAEEQHRGRVRADLADRADPLRRDADRLRHEAIREVAGASHRLPSGPLHDAAEVSRAGIPTVMLFVQSLRGLSHTKLEDTKPEHLELAVQALDRLAYKTIDWVASLSGPTVRPAAVVFDCDGLLLETEPCWTLAEEELFDRHGKSFGDDEKRRSDRDVAYEGSRDPAPPGPARTAEPLGRALLDLVERRLLEEATAFPMRSSS